MAGMLERRRSPRIIVAGHLGAQARATLNVRIVDLSAVGVRIEHSDILRPGATYAFELPPVLGSLILNAGVVHSAVMGAEANPEGERHLRYQSGLAFVGVTAEQQSALESILDRLVPGGGLGDGHLTAQAPTP
jgi:hypothetical protein